MLQLITGSQRAGKSYSVCSFMIDYLKRSNRHIFTNLPIHPDIMCDYACGGKQKNPALYSIYLSRIHIFKTFLHVVDCFDFVKKNPDFVSDHRQNLITACKVKNEKWVSFEDSAVSGEKKYFLDPFEKLKHFWDFSVPNSVHFYDEVYEFIGQIGQKSVSAELQKQMLAYCKQHGHFKDDVYLITHDPRDLNVIIRRSVAKTLVIQNSKYTNMIEGIEFFEGLTFPNQFFMVSVYLGSNSKAEEKFCIHPVQAIFRCYDSFSVSSILGKEHASELSSSSDVGESYFRTFDRWLSRRFIFICIYVIVGSFFIGGIYSYCHPPKKKEPKKILKVGDLYEQKKIISISDSNIICCDDSGYYIYCKKN